MIVSIMKIVRKHWIWCETANWKTFEHHGSNVISHQQSNEAHGQ